ncbi:cellulose binding domain-containing protein [Dactylosporangium vinaceum]|uniref:Cellulose binding domain-containing protein n=1 Tax=Dactylosporangium vinaceum TaxID=53362 RepID=A0ABV5ME80_9ACTN|nr:cellulose binding domain-containing protein [Dactylosporangium vinaceum]
MAVSRRSAALGIIGAAASTAALALLLTPAVAGGAPPMTAAAAAALTGSCSATAHVDSQWYGGEVVTVTITNTSASAATTWAATWTLATGQQVVSAWNASVTTTGGTTTAVNASYNGALQPGASTTFGMQLSGPAVAPTVGCTDDAPGSSTGADVTVTEADSGRTLTLQVGQSIAVNLPSQYLPPTAGTNLVQLTSTGGYPSGQPVAAVFRAVVPGPADITTHTDAACLHDPRPCTIPIRLWQVHIIVADVPSTGQTVTLTQVDTTRLLSLHVGDLLVVKLSSMYRPLELSNRGVLLLRDTTGGYPTGQPLTARYTAAIPGRTDLSTVTDNACLHQPTPCPTPQVAWSVHITVTA